MHLKRSDLEGDVISRRKNRYGYAFRQLQSAVPRVELHASAQRQCLQLTGFGIVRFRSLRQQFWKAHGSAIHQSISHECRYEIGNLTHPIRQGTEKQTHRASIVFVRGLRKYFESACVSGLQFGGRSLKVKPEQKFMIREHGQILKSELRDAAVA